LIILVYFKYLGYLHVDCSKVARLEEQMESLQRRGPDTSTAVALLQLQQHQQHQQHESSVSPSSSYNQHIPQRLNIESPVSIQSSNHGPSMLDHNPQFVPTHIQPPASQSQPYFAAHSPSRAPKRKHGNFELHVEKQIDAVSKGLIQQSDAELYFETFFQGCVSCAETSPPSIR